MLLSLFLFFFIANPLIMLIEITVAGIPVLIAGKLLSTDLFSKVFFPGGRKKFSFTSGWFFSINSLLVPLRVCRYILSGFAAVLLVIAKIHPAVKKHFENL